MSCLGADDLRSRGEDTVSALATWILESLAVVGLRSLGRGERVGMIGKVQFIPGGKPWYDIANVFLDSQTETAYTHLVRDEGVGGSNPLTPTILGRPQDIAFRAKFGPFWGVAKR